MELLIPIALILVGLALVAVEVALVPGTNVVGVVGVLGAAAGVVLAFVEFGPAGGLGTLAATVLAAGGLGYVLWESGAWSRFVLSDALLRDTAADATESESRARLLNRAGTAVTPLRPAGLAEIDGQRVEVETEGAYVASGSRVHVIALDRRRVIVRIGEGQQPGRGSGAG